MPDPKNTTEKTPEPPMDETTLAYERELQDKKDIIVAVKTRGGQIILESAEKSCEVAILALVADYKTASHPHLVALIAKLEANLSIVATMTKAESEVDNVRIILESLKK